MWELRSFAIYAHPLVWEFNLPECIGCIYTVRVSRNSLWLVYTCGVAVDATRREAWSLHTGRVLKRPQCSHPSSREAPISTSNKPWVSVIDGQFSNRIRREFCCVEPGRWPQTELPPNDILGFLLRKYECNVTPIFSTKFLKSSMSLMYIRTFISRI